MSIERHAENRTWAFQALEELEAFLSDVDYEGAAGDESSAIAKKAVELRDNKYRVVVLGAFNVGKSALINALLGEEYLPTILEECTTKITHVLKSESMRVLLKLNEPSAESEIQALSDLCTGLGISVTVSETEQRDVALDFADDSPASLVKCLRPLVTMSADEDFPQLRMLRAKFDELFIFVPNELLPEDVALIDSPGAHSISATNRKIANDIIPDSHLVLCLLDSQSAGNEQDRAFIESVAGHRHRKMFFVINKSDQLNPEEIDLYGRRGPARDLLRSMEGIVDGPEMFFISSLYALTGRLLHTGRLSLSDIDQNHKIKIPLALHEPLLAADDPCKVVAEYLSHLSRFEPFKMRLLEYLYNENREGAVLESVCRFIDGRAWSYSRPIEVKMEMARNMPRLGEINAQRERVYAAIDANRKTTIDALNAYTAMSGGGAADGQEYPGYEAILERTLSQKAVDDCVVKPILDWLKNDANVKNAKKAGYKPVAEELESRLEAFLAVLYGELDKEIMKVEQNVLDRLGDIATGMAGGLRAGASGTIDADRASVGEIRPSLAGSYFGFGMLAAVIGAAAGAAIGHGISLPAPYDPTIIGVAAGAACGLIAGMLIRSLTARRAVKSKLGKIVADWTDRIVFKGTTVKGVKDQVKEKVQACRTAFGELAQAALDQDLERLNRQVSELNAEEEAIHAKQAQILARLEPKHAKLTEIWTRARGIAEANSPK